MSDATKSNALRSLRLYSFAGLTAVLVLFVGLGGWATMTKLSGAVIASGATRRRV